ncbi:MAG: 23S rRNA (uracil(1939)-C(5))-methyltransferase RlmD, partial [Candidatus Omnitrophota bacterium]
MKLCRHFGLCGGCRYQDIPYQEQLAKKEERLKELIRESNQAIECRPINSFPQWFYRNKMEFTFSGEKEAVICGLHTKEKKRIVFDLNECLIFSRDTAVLVEAVKEFVNNRKYSPYNKFSHQGFLRHLIVREGKFSDELMLGIVTSGQDGFDAQGFVDRMLSLPLNKKPRSIYWIVNDSFGDAVTFEKKNLLYGEAFITEELAGFKFKISIDSFFQTNPYGIEELYKKIVAYALLSKEDSVLDLYCGSGAIGIFLAKKAKSVLGVEVDSAAIAAAVANARTNGVDNISFVCGDTNRFLAENNLAGKISLIVANPPRCGLSKKMKAKLLDTDVPYMFYSSCNPQTLFSDLGDLSFKYNTLFVEGFDFFPHT